MNRKISSVAIAALVLSTITVSPVAAQSWYSEFLNIDNSAVAGAKTTRGKPTEIPSSQAQNRPDTSTRGNANDTTQSSDKGTGESKATENAPTFLRRNTFSELSEMKDLSPEERQERIAELRNATRAERCEVIEANVSRRIDYYQNSQTDHVSRYQGIVVGLTKSSERLSVLGYDTSNLESMIDQLQSQINEMNLIHNKLIAALQEVNIAQCGDEEIDPGSKGTLAKTTVQELRTKALAIKDYIRNVIFLEIQSFKEQNVDDTTEEIEDTPNVETDN